MLGRLPTVEFWNLSDPKRVALLYLQHGRRLGLPAPKALMDDAVKRRARARIERTLGSRGGTWARVWSVIGLDGPAPTGHGRDRGHSVPQQ